MAWIRALFVSLLVLASACTSGDAESTTTEAETTSTTAASATTTTPPSTTSTLEPSTTITTTDPDHVGSREVMLEEMRAAWEANRFTYDWDFEDAYIPDLQNPDPLVALEELITLTEWLAEHGGADLWWQVLTVTDSPAFDFWRSTLRRIDGDIYLDREGGQRFTVSEVRLASASETESIVGLLDRDPPEGTQFLLYSGADPDGGIRVFAPTGEEIDEYLPYEVVDRAVALSPTSSGWAFFWGEW